MYDTKNMDAFGGK